MKRKGGGLAVKSIEVYILHYKTEEINTKHGNERVKTTK